MNKYPFNIKTEESLPTNKVIVKNDSQEVEIINVGTYSFDLPKNTALQQENTQLKSELQESQRLYKNSIDLACDFDKRREEEMYKRIVLEKELQALRERFKELEWSASSFDPGFCPSCGNYKVDGHKEDCWLAAELDQLKGVE